MKQVRNYSLHLGLFEDQEVGVPVVERKGWAVDLAADNCTVAAVVEDSHILEAVVAQVEPHKAGLGNQVEELHCKAEDLLGTVG